MNNSPVNAITKFHQSEATLKMMTQKALNEPLRDFSYTPLAGGYCNMIYLIEANGQEMVLKIAPEKDVLIMRHERDIILTEAKMLKEFNELIDIQMPRLIYRDDSLEICPVPYFFMSYLEGESLLTMETKPNEDQIIEIKREIGVISRKISSIKASNFGIPAMPETFTKSNCDFIKNLFRMLLQDALDKQIPVPGPSFKELLDLIETQRTVLDEVTDPVYIHTDTWDGNIMVKDNCFNGLVDFAAILYGDPLMNHDFHDFSSEPRKEFLEGYGKTSFTKNELIRISFYKIWQRLGMIVERGYRNYEDENLYAWVIGEYTKELGLLENLINNKNI